MEGGGVMPATDQQTMVSLFLEIAVGQTADTARQFLQATSWQLEDAVQLFYAGNEFGSVTAPSHVPPVENEAFTSAQSTGWGDDDVAVENVGGYNDGEVRAPLPVKRDVLYDSPMHYGASRLGVYQHELDTPVPEEPKQPGIWEAEKGSTSATEASGDNNNLASLYRPPFELLFHGSFEKAKEAAIGQDRWLLVNVQSTREFNSHMLNRDTWANEAVAQTITNNFVFWQVYDDAEEGSKVNTYYKLDSVPVTLVIDPVTGQKMRLWRGMIEPESLLEDLLQFMDGSPKDHHFNLSNKRSRDISHTSPPKIEDETNEDDEEMRLARILSLGTMNDSAEDSLKDSGVVEKSPKKDECCYPPLPEEPKGDTNLLCRVGIRLPDGRRLQRNFLRTDPIKLLWSFCAANCGNEKPFRLSHAIPGAVKEMDYESTLTFEESGVANSMISVSWREVV
ncbi:plant UBX domain-containing protein 7-like [Rutidosis leptorrhynchoides]|uniref:plant UBX domain-containing protein 7-like n=1 Tax=Rutidosis leptorrhynchoides TaxID=125765 RepID=UPI003A99C5CF